MAIRYRLSNVTPQEAQATQEQSRRAFNALVVQSLDKIFGGMFQIPETLAEQKRKDDYFNLQKDQYENAQKSKKFNDQLVLAEIMQKSPELGRVLLDTEYGRELFGARKDQLVSEDGKVYNVEDPFTIKPPDLPVAHDLAEGNDVRGYPISETRVPYRGTAGVPPVFQQETTVGQEQAQSVPIEQQIYQQMRTPDMPETGSYPTVEGRPDYRYNYFYPPPPNFNGRQSGDQNVTVRVGSSAESNAGARAGQIVKQKAGLENATYVKVGGSLDELARRGQLGARAQLFSALTDKGMKIAVDKRYSGEESAIENLETYAQSLMAQFPDEAIAIRERTEAMKRSLRDSPSDAFQLGVIRSAGAGKQAGGVTPKDRFAALKDRISIEGRIMSANLSMARTLASTGDNTEYERYIGAAQGNQANIQKLRKELTELQEKYGFGIEELAPAVDQPAMPSYPTDPTMPTQAPLPPVQVDPLSMPTPGVPVPQNPAQSIAPPVQTAPPTTTAPVAPSTQVPVVPQAPVVTPTHAATPVQPTQPELTFEPLDTGKPKQAGQAKAPTKAGKAPTVKQAGPIEVGTAKPAMDLLDQAWKTFQKKSSEAAKAEPTETPASDAVVTLDKVTPPDLGVSPAQLKGVTETVSRLTDPTNKKFVAPGSPEEASALTMLWTRKSRKEFIPVVSAERKKLGEYVVAFAKDPNNPSLRSALVQQNEKLNKIQLGLTAQGMRDLVLRQAPPDSQLGQVKTTFEALNKAKESETQKTNAWDSVYSVSNTGAKEALLAKFPALRSQYERKRTFRDLLDKSHVEFLVEKGYVQFNQLPLEIKRQLVSDSLNKAVGF